MNRIGAMLSRLLRILARKPAPKRPMTDAELAAWVARQMKDRFTRC